MDRFLSLLDRIEGFASERTRWSLTCILVFSTSVGCSMTADRTPENPPETKLATE